MNTVLDYLAMGVWTFIIVIAVVGMASSFKQLFKNDKH